MNIVTYTRPSTELRIDENTDVDALINTIDTAIPPLPTDTPHDNLVVESFKFAVMELKTRIQEDEPDISLSSLRTCLELLRDKYCLRIHTDEGTEIFIESTMNGEFIIHTRRDQRCLQWDTASNEESVRNMVRNNPVTITDIRVVT